MHELLRQYGAEKLAESFAACERAHNRHSAFYLAILQQWVEDLNDVAQLEVDASNIQAAWSWAAKRVQAERLDQALDGLCRFYERFVHYQQGELACRAAAERLTAEACEDLLRLLARILIWQGAFNRLLERPEIASGLFQQSEQILDRLSLAGQDIRHERALLLLEMGHLALHTDRQEARRWHTQSLALFQDLDDRWGAVSALRELGRIAMYLGDYAQARQMTEQCLAIQRTMSDRWGIADALLGLATAIFYQGQYEEAIRLLQEAIAIAGDIGNRVFLVDVTGMMGAVLATVCRFDEGHTMLEETVAIYSSLGRTWVLAHWNALLGMIKMWMGKYQEARVLSEMNLSLSQEIEYPRGVGQSCWVLSGIALIEESYEKALAWAQQSAAVFQEIGQLEELSYALSFLAFADLGLGNVIQARQHLRDALQMVVQVQGPHPLCYALPGAALLLAKQGERERAVEVYALAAARFPLVRNSEIIEKIAGRQIAAATASLPPETRSTAQAHGRSGDLEFIVQQLLRELGE